MSVIDKKLVIFFDPLGHQSQNNPKHHNEFDLKINASIRLKTTQKPIKFRLRSQKVAKHITLILHQLSSLFTIFSMALEREPLTKTTVSGDNFSIRFCASSS